MIEWISHEDQNIITLEYTTHENELELSFQLINDTLNGKIYTCRVTRSGSELIEQNFTMNVESTFRQSIKDNEHLVISSQISSSSSCKVYTEYEYSFGTHG